MRGELPLGVTQHGCSSDRVGIIKIVRVEWKISGGAFYKWQLIRRYLKVKDPLNNPNVFLEQWIVKINLKFLYKSEL